MPKQGVQEAIARIHAGYMSLDEVAVKCGDPAVLAFAAIEAEQYGAQLSEVAASLKQAALRAADSLIESAA